MRFAVGVIFSWEKTPRLLECQKVPPKAYGQIGWHKEEINAVEMWRGGGRRERCWPPTPFKPNITASIDSNQVLQANAARLNAIHLHLHSWSLCVAIVTYSPFPVSLSLPLQDVLDLQALWDVDWRWEITFKLIHHCTDQCDQCFYSSTVRLSVNLPALCWY